MSDDSHLDTKYFIDEHVYNCPFCNRGNVSYNIAETFIFDWKKDKECYLYITKCNSNNCGRKSLHLSFFEIPLVYDYHGKDPRFDIDTDESEIDDYFFYSVPTSFFSLDNRIPRELRQLYTEAEGCLKSNFLTGASVCVRKLIYELAILENAEGGNYEERIKSLKKIRDDVEGDFFDTLLTIQQITSDKVHEDSFDGWESKHLRLILTTLSDILQLMYVIPEMRKEKRVSILALKEEIESSKE